MYRILHIPTGEILESCKAKNKEICDNFNEFEFFEAD